MISEETVVKRSTDTAWQVVEEKAVVVTPRDRQIHILDGTGGRIWECIETPRRVGDIVKTIEEDFEVAAATALKETVTFLQELLEKGIVAVEEQESGAPDGAKQG